MREWILAALAAPAIGASALAAGLVGIIAEFLLPARVVPGALGGVLLMLGLWSLLPEHTSVALATLTSMALIALPLLRIAARARRNKLEVK